MKPGVAREERIFEPGLAKKLCLIESAVTEVRTSSGGVVEGLEEGLEEGFGEGGGTVANCGAVS